MANKLSWAHPGREEVHLEWSLEKDQLTDVSMKVIGSLPFLRYSQDIKKTLAGPLDQVPLPVEKTSFALIWREVILKIQNKWEAPIPDGDLCHCRKVSGEKVARAIVYGAHSLNELRLRTSANTGCGTCLNDVQSILDYYLVRK